MMERRMNKHMRLSIIDRKTIAVLHAEAWECQDAALVTHPNQ